jgi:hypothetical protein
MKYHCFNEEEKKQEASERQDQKVEEKCTY